MDFRLFQAEHLSERTGSYLYIAALHPAARKPFFHFVSKKLRQHSPEGVQEIHGAANVVMTALLENEKVDTIKQKMKTLQVEQQLEETQAQLAKAIADGAEQKEAIARLLSIVQQSLPSVANIPSGISQPIQ